MGGSVDSVTRTVENGDTDMLKRIRYDPGRFTGRTTSGTLYSTLDTVLVFTLFDQFCDRTKASGQRL
jgi:hypothetical protein